MLHATFFSLYLSQHYMEEIEWIIHIDVDEYFYRPSDKAPGFLRRFVASQPPAVSQVSGTLPRTPARDAPAPWSFLYPAVAAIGEQYAQAGWIAGGLNPGHLLPRCLLPASG